MSTFPWLCKTDKDCEKLISMFGADPDGSTPPVHKCGWSMMYNITAGGELNIDDVR